MAVAASSVAMLKATSGVLEPTIRGDVATHADVAFRGRGNHFRDLYVKTEKLVDLKGGLKQTASSAQIKSDGSLVIELHDFSSEAEKWLGNEVAFLIKVSPGDKRKMLSCLLPGRNQMLAETQEDDLLLQLIGERFTDYFEVKQWIEENQIPYEKEFDPWA